jgi:hypothetical protein
VRRDPPGLALLLVPLLGLGKGKRGFLIGLAVSGGVYRGSGWFR